MRGNLCSQRKVRLLRSSADVRTQLTRHHSLLPNVNLGIEERAHHWEGTFTFCVYKPDPSPSKLQQWCQAFLLIASTFRSVRPVIALIMHGLYRHLSHLFCCAPFPRKSDDHSSESLSTLPTVASPLSVPLPHDTIPHGSSESNTNDAEALHHIFSSSSSVRGYQTAATTPGYISTTRPSFDREYRSGSNSPSKPLQTPIERLSNHIRSRLSESRLSKASSKHGVRSPDVDLHHVKESSPLKENINPPAANKQSTAELTDILASRNASQGGYDSDAHTIASPLLRSNAGTIKLSPGFVKQALESFKPPVPGRALAPLPRPGSVDGHLSPPKNAPGHGQERSSSLPATPSKSVFAAALQLGINESPTEALRRLSAGIGNGTIKVPNIPEIEDMNLRSTRQVDSHWRLTAPERTSSLNQLDKDLNAKLKRLSDTVESAKRDSMLQVDDIDQRASLISELDPALLDYMSRYADRPSSEENHDDDVDDKDHDEGEKTMQSQEHHDLSSPPEVRNPEVSKPDIQSLSETDSDSIHLFNMRISQRLASQSQMRIQSPYTSNNTSTKSLAATSAVNYRAHAYGAITNLPRYPTRIASEHNRRPSDPQTRRLFESDARVSKPDRCMWKTVTSVHSGSTSFDRNPMFKRLQEDDGGSFYFNDGEIGQSQLNSPLSGSPRSSLHNPHSLAIGGRSVSAGAPSEPANQSTQAKLVRSKWYSRRPSQDQSRASEDSWLAAGKVTERGRSVSMPQKNNHVQQASPTPDPKRLRNNTEDAENISEISLEKVLDRRNEGLTEITAQELQDKCDEKLSKIDHRLLTVPNSFQSSFVNTGNNSPTALRTASPSKDRLGAKAFAPDSVSHNAAAGGLKQSGRYGWAKAFRNARKGSIDTPSGGFLTAPRYDRDGRRRQSVRSSASDEGSFIRSPSISGSRRSQSVSAARRSSASLDLDAHQRLCSITRGPLPRLSPTIKFVHADSLKLRRHTERRQPKARKKSILELGRRIASVALPADEDRKSETPPQHQDLLGIWARFPSHTRAERNGSATTRDGVKAKDFLPMTAATETLAYPTASTEVAPNPMPIASRTLGPLRNKTSRRLDRGKSKSMTLRTRTSTLLSPEEKARRGRKGLLGRWKRLYRGSSSELRRYANAHGHRSSFSAGDDPEHPDLECLPGEGLFRPTNFHGKMLEDRSEDPACPPESSLTKRDTTTPADGDEQRSHRRLDASEWGRIYRQCVGSLFALKSEDEEVMSTTLSDQARHGPDARIGDVASMELRRSTSNFYHRISIDQEAAKEALLTKAGTIGNVEEEWQDVQAGEDDPQDSAYSEDESTDGHGEDAPERARVSSDLKVPGRFVS